MGGDGFPGRYRGLRFRPGGHEGAVTLRSRGLTQCPSESTWVHASGSRGPGDAAAVRQRGPVTLQAAIHVPVSCSPTRCPVPHIRSGGAFPSLKAGRALSSQSAPERNQDTSLPEQGEALSRPPTGRTPTSAPLHLYQPVSHLLCAPDVLGSPPEGSHSRCQTCGLRDDVSCAPNQSSVVSPAATQLPVCPLSVLPRGSPL